MSKHEFNPKIIELVEQLPADAQAFLRIFSLYCHSIDDVIDEEDVRADPQKILRAFYMALELYSSRYYRDNHFDLYPLIKMVTRAYSDSVYWEGSLDEWKRNIADGIRNISNEVAIYIYGNHMGWDKQQEFSLLMREDSYKKHHTKEHKPI